MQLSQFSALYHHHFPPSPSLRASEHFPKPHRDTRVEPFDARCCRGYWIKVSRFAEEIISRAARTARAATSRTLFSIVALRSSFCRNHHTAAFTRHPERNLPMSSLPPLSLSISFTVLSFGFSRLVVFLCRQNALRRHLALNIYGKVPSRNYAMVKLFATSLPAD